MFAIDRGGEELGLEVFRRPRGRSITSTGCLPVALAALRSVMPSRCLFSGRMHSRDHDLIEVARDEAFARHLVLERVAAARVAELRLALRDRAGGGFAPRIGVVEQVPVLEGEGEAGVGGDALAIDRNALLAAPLEPLRIVLRWRCGKRSLRRTASNMIGRPLIFGQLLVMAGILLGIPARQRQFLEALAALTEHLARISMQVSSCMTSVSIGEPS